MKKFIYIASLIVIALFILWEIPPNEESQNITTTVSNFGRMDINTSNGLYPYLKEYQQANISYYDSNGTILKMDIPGDVRCRGNSTFSFAKKAYKIKLDQNTSILQGEEKTAKEWVLLANYKDGSMLRNQFAFQMSNVLDNMAFVPDSEFVDLYINDTYMGVYQLCDQVEVGYGRLEIDTALPAHNAGFLITLDTLSSGYLYQDYFEITHKYTYKTPIYNEEQGKRIEDILLNVEDAIATGSEELISKAIDLPSCIDMYILQEFSKNYDVGWASFYLFADRGSDQIFFGPPWDFDIAFGNDERLDNGSYEDLFVGNQTYIQWHSHIWYMQLMSYPWFQEDVKLRWNEIKDGLYLEIDILEQFAKDNESFFLKDTDKYMFTDMDKEIWLLDFDYVTSTKELIDWLYNRYHWLDTYFNKNF